MISNILCPVDCSGCSRRALQLAIAIANWRDAHVKVINVGPAVLLYPAVVARVTPAAVATPTRAERAMHLARFLQPHMTAYRPIDVILEEGDAAVTIAAAIRPYAVDLIVMGTHGRSGIARLTFGSVTEHVIQAASCPVLVVPPGAPLLPAFQGFTRILCSTSIASRESARVLTADRAHVTALPPTESYDDILQAASEARPDLIVWDRECAASGTLVRNATVPVLSVSALRAAQRRVHQAEEYVP
jgi:nucleotide-binding universal stress UspA family protein